MIGDRERWIRHRSFDQGLRRPDRSPRAGLTLAAGSGALALALSILAARRFADTPLPLSRGHPGLLTAAGLLFLVAYALKICAWRRVFAADERPQARALAAATGGASIAGLALPGRCTDVVRIAIVRRYPGCPAGVRALCLSLVVLGLIDLAALAPLALALAVMPGHSSAARVALTFSPALDLQPPPSSHCFREWPQRGGSRALGSAAG